MIHPERAGAASAELVREARLVRQALEKLQAGDEAGAMGMLRDLARSSPLSEWKFFVRGLAAFYRGDEAETRANWDRLDPKRTAGRDRRAAAAAGRARPPARIRASLESAEKLAFGEPILDRLRQLGSLVAGQEWDKVLRLLGPLRHSLHRIDPKLAERLTVVLIGSMIKAVQDMDWHEAHALVSRFTRVAQPMAIDPRWNRLWAMIWDGPHADARRGDRTTGPTTSRTSRRSRRSAPRSGPWPRRSSGTTWPGCIARRSTTCSTIPTGRPRCRSEASAPGGKAGSRSGTIRRSPPPRRTSSTASRRACGWPRHLPTYQLLVEVHDDWEDDKGLEAAAKRLLAQFPEDWRPSSSWAGITSRPNDLVAALPYIQQARRLKPLDDSLRELEWMIRVGLARLSSPSKEMGRGAGRVRRRRRSSCPRIAATYNYLARKAIFESKAGQAEQSDHYVERGQGDRWSSRPRSGWRWRSSRSATRCPRPRSTVHQALGGRPEEEVSQRDGRRDGRAAGGLPRRRDRVPRPRRPHQAGRRLPGAAPRG